MTVKVTPSQQRRFESDDSSRNHQVPQQLFAEQNSFTIRTISVIGQTRILDPVVLKC